ncbi:DarB-like antirestriction [Pseudomonas phage SL2]|uniref:DOD-type homing endonuclease domain-containing protein n=1 Tax=Pseudomonas phage SL2 TaxID=2041345 RepID=A0A2D1GQV2_9CAUD|nr:DarB-like antirestriction [Pseudomonas phage SL2]ATN94712.1 hypothetical protein SL2_135 [Pseudomonas phage SL2]
MGTLSITETDQEIIISGFDGAAFIRDINKYWRTTKLSTQLFNTVSRSSVSFYKFFAPEVYYMLEAVKNYRSRYISIKTVNAIREAMLQYTWLKNTRPVDPNSVPGRLNFKMLDKLTFIPDYEQKAYFENYNYRIDQYGLRGDIVAGQPGTGKAQPLDSLIKIPGGWKKMGDIKVGDLVTSSTGEPTEVIGVYPQGKKRTYTFEFSDGRKTKACGEHLWRVYCEDWVLDSDGWKIISTDELKDALSTNVTSKYYVQLCKSETNPNIDLPIDPYTVGKTLGENKIRSEQTVFISNEYLHGSDSQRLSLLQGLMDTCGEVDSSGKISFTSNSYTLVEQVQYLVRSLGGIAKIIDTKEHDYKVDITISTPSILFHLHDEAKYNKELYQHLDELKLQITSIVESDEVECQCIAVSAPDHLYITDDFIVTHNTFMTMAIAEMVESEIIIVVCEKKSIELVWKPSIIEMYKDKQTVWTTADDRPYNGQRILISHYQAQDKIIDILRSGILKNKKITVILDESHNMNDPNSAQSLKFQQICFMTDSDNRLLASGTPVKALGSELVSALRVLDDLFTKEVEERFKKAFGRDTQKGLDIIQHRFGLIAYVIEKKDTDVLPPKIKSYRIKIPNGSQYTLNAIKRDCEAFIRERVKFYAARRPEDEKYWAKLMTIHENSLKTPAQREGFARYKNLIKIIQKNPDPRYIGEEIKESNLYEKMFIEPTLPRNEIANFRDIKSVIKYVMLKIQGECLGRVLGAKRIQCHVDMVPYIDWVGITESTMKKTITFTSFVEVVDAVDKYTNKLGMKSAVVYGKTNDNLPQIVYKFEKDPKLNPLVATYASLSTAVRMTMADTMVTINSPFRHYILEQAIARIYRKGQDSQTVVYQCTLDTEDEPNISTRSDDILKWSQAMVEAIMGIKSPFEITESLESYVDKNNNFDENKIIYQMLKESFEKYDIAIDFNDFDTRMYKPYQPAYMRF